MHELQRPYLRLHDLLIEYDGDQPFSDILAPWLADTSQEILWLQDLRTRADPAVPLTQEENWRLYALSRIVDLLTLSFAPHLYDEAGCWRLAPISQEQFVIVMTRLGLKPLAVQKFHPFFHEIVTVVTDVESSAPTIKATLWPGFRLGPLIISRSGCVVSAAATELSPEIAASSTLYWAYARNTRPTADLSDGWGHNSQWRTSFRLDYEVDGTLYYNTGVRSLPNDEDEALNPGLTADEKLELLRYRCFVRCRKNHDDWWPYDWSFVEEPNP